MTGKREFILGQKSSVAMIAPGIDPARIAGNPEERVGQLRCFVFKRPYALTAVAKSDSASHV